MNGESIQIKNKTEIFNHKKGSLRSAFNYDSNEQMEKYSNPFLPENNEHDDEDSESDHYSDVGSFLGLKRNNSENKKQLRTKEASKFNVGRWSEIEHKKFLEAILKYGNEWKKVQKFIVTRSSTQARSHAQKFFLRLKKYLISSASKDPSLSLSKNDFIFESIKDNKGKIFFILENHKYESVLKFLNEFSNFQKDDDLDVDFEKSYSNSISLEMREKLLKIIKNFTHEIPNGKFKKLKKKFTKPITEPIFNELSNSDSQSLDYSKISESNVNSPVEDQSRLEKNAIFVIQKIKKNKQDNENLYNKLSNGNEFIFQNSKLKDENVLSSTHDLFCEAKIQIFLNSDEININNIVKHNEMVSKEKERKTSSTCSLNSTINTISPKENLSFNFNQQKVYSESLYDKLKCYFSKNDRKSSEVKPCKYKEDSRKSSIRTECESINIFPINGFIFSDKNLIEKQTNSNINIILGSKEIGDFENNPFSINFEEKHFVYFEENENSNLRRIDEFEIFENVNSLY